MAPDEPETPVERGPRRWLAAAAAAMIVTVGIAGTVALVDNGDEGDRGDGPVVTDDATSSVPPTEPTTRRTLPPIRTTTLPTESGPRSFAEFCAAYADLEGEQPESYVGSEAHVADIDRLLAVAPDAVSAELEAFRDYLSSGAIDSAADPESNLTESWPADVQAAVARVQTVADENC